jgi:hypothetical protein
MNELFPIIRRKRRPLLPVVKPQAVTPAVETRLEHETDRTEATNPPRTEGNNDEPQTVSDQTP